MTTALIIGGGIAGPATAIGLHKAGINAAIYEAYPPAASDDAGAFVTIAANGQDALQAIDVLDPALSASFPAHRIRMSDPAGTTLADITLGSDHPCPQSITRAALSQVLRASTLSALAAISSVASQQRCSMQRLNKSNRLVDHDLSS